MSGSLANRMAEAEAAVIDAGFVVNTPAVLTNLAEALTVTGQFSITVADLIGLASVLRGEGQKDG